jgi:hypothetical protein
VKKNIFCEASIKTLGRIYANTSNTTGTVVCYEIATTAGVSRWKAGTQAAESGSNLGGDFFFNNYDDAGNSIGQPLKIARSTGEMYLSVGLTLPTTGGTPCRLNHYEEFTLVVNFTGPRTASNITIRGVRIGWQVTLHVSGCGSAASGSAAYFTSSAAIKSSFRPVNNTIKNCGINVESGGSQVLGTIQVDTAGNVFVLTGVGGNFAASGNCGWAYSLNATYIVEW